VRGKSSAVTSLFNNQTANDYRVYVPNADIERVTSGLRTGGGLAALKVTPLEGLLVAGAVAPLPYPAPVLSRLVEWREDKVSAIGHARTVWIRGMNWGPFPLATELWLEAEYLDSVNGGTVAIAKSTAVIAMNDVWTAFEVNFVPLQPGHVTYRIMLGLSVPTAELYIDGGMEMEDGSFNEMSWADGLPVVNANFFLQVPQEAVGDEAIIAFDVSDTGLAMADVIWDFCYSVIDNLPVSTANSTLVAVGGGVYILRNPNVRNKTVFRVHKNLVPATYSEGTFLYDSVVSGESLEFVWTEYEQGHDNPPDPAYVIEDVLVAVFGNTQGTGTSLQHGITDETGSVGFFLDPGTYWLFRRKAGWTFSNPVEITVSAEA
jgi:hypothetical protein